MPFHRLADGMIAEAHNGQELLGPLQQLDVIPDSSRKIVRLMVGQLSGRPTDRWTHCVPQPRHRESSNAGVPSNERPRRA